MTRRIFLKLASFFEFFLAFFNISCENESRMTSDQSIKKPTDQLNKPGEMVSDIFVAKKWDAPAKCFKNHRDDGWY